MDSQAFTRAFTYFPNTPEQDADLEEVYRQAKLLAVAITERVHEKYADQALAQLGGVLSVCRNAIELSPKQAKPLVLV